MEDESKTFRNHATPKNKTLHNRIEYNKLLYNIM